MEVQDTHKKEMEFLQQEIEIIKQKINILRTKQAEEVACSWEHYIGKCFRYEYDQDLPHLSAYKKILRAYDNGEYPIMECFSLYRNTRGTDTITIQLNEKRSLLEERWQEISEEEFAKIWSTIEMLVSERIRR